MFPIIILLLLQSITVIGAPIVPNPILDINAINKAISPCDDFYQYACGTWLRKTKIPSDKSATYRQWTLLDDISEKKLNDLLTQYSNGDFHVKSKYAEQLGAVYGSCMAKNLPENKTKLLELLSSIDRIDSPKAFAEMVAGLQERGINVLFSFYGAPDNNDSTRMIGYMDQGGMSLPDREFYLKQDAKSQKILRSYDQHTARTFQLLETAGNTSTILQLETQLAKHALPLDDRRDPEKTNNPMSISDFKKLAPKFDWDSYFAYFNLSQMKKIIVSEPEFYKGLNAILETWKAEDLKTYLRWQTIHSFSEAAGGKLENENFVFFKKTLAGTKKKQERWKVCTHLTGSLMNEALGEAYVNMVSGDAQKKYTQELIDGIKQSFAKNLDRLDWIDSSTKKAALEKLGKLNQKIAYPNQWRNYDTLKATSSNIVTNVAKANQFNTRFNLSKIGLPVDKNEWQMSVWEANAYYEASRNEIVFPLAELLPPVLDLQASDGANFGALGATVGHELTHGYDDSGRHYDADGNLKDWWSENTSKRFEEKSACFIEQAGKYRFGDLAVNGKATLGENLADQGGTKLAYLAFQARKTAAQKPRTGDFSEEQEFFISYAQSWCGKNTEESLRNQILSDYHPPVEFRVNAVVMNMPEFAKAFSCKEGSRMAPANRCFLW